MPIHLNEIDVTSQVEGADSVLITACNMCAGASLAMRDNVPFLNFFGSSLKSPPLEKHIRELVSQLKGNGVRATKFKAGVIQQFFLCLWTSRQRRRFREEVERHDAVIVLGCDSALDTAREAVSGTSCRVIKGMSVAGVMNTRTRFRLPGVISFAASQIVPMCDLHCQRNAKDSLQEV